MRFQSSVLILIAFAITAMPCRALDVKDRESIDEMVQKYLKDKPYACVSIGVTVAGKHEFMHYGTLTLDGKKATPSDDTIFEIGSISKLMTGTLLAESVIRKELKLDDSASNHLPVEWKLPTSDDREITLLHLATHTSSLPVQPPTLPLLALANGNLKNPYDKFDSKQLAQSLSSLRLTYPIGSRFDYSNLGVGLLGHALATRTKSESFEKLMIERIAKPLKLRDTSIRMTEKQEKRLAPGHTTDGEVTSPWTFATLEACGGIRSSTSDLLNFLDAASDQTPSKLSDAFKLSQKPWRELPRKGSSVGLCWMIDNRENGNAVFWHNGGTGGYRSYMAYQKKDKSGVVVLTNSASSVDQLGLSIMKLLEEKAYAK